MDSEATKDGAPQSTSRRRPRRELLAGAAGALGVLAAEAVVKATPAHAADNDPVTMGSANSEVHRTWIDKTAQDGYAVFQGNSTGSDPGLLGNSPAGIGVYGVSGSGTGVYGQSGSTAGATGTRHGMHGVTDAAGYCGVFGEYVGTGQAAAVQGTNLSGSGQGVVGYGTSGVLGLATSGGTGIVASEALDGTGLAFHAVGGAAFDLSGIVSIPAGATSATVTGVSLRSGSLVLATVQNNAGVYVKYAAPNVSGSKVTINLNKAVPSGKTAKVAWFIVN